ncbi:FkbM family methyltransferase [Roseicyclus sp.]
MSRRFDRKRIETLVGVLSPARLTRIVDVGANPVNASPYRKLLAAGLCDLWGFEPDARSFAELTQTAHETYLNHAVGDGSRGTLHLTRGPALTSLFRPDPAAVALFQRFGDVLEVERELEVETRALDAMEELPEFDLLKIDVQGAEVMVYEGARGHLDRAVAVISEVGFVPLYEGQPLLDAQMVALRARGMDLHKFMFAKPVALRGGLAGKLDQRAHANQLLDGDAVFLRSLRSPEAMTDEQLKHMAILADAVFESHDVAVRCLDLLIARGVVDRRAAKAYVGQVPDLAGAAKAAAG